MRYCALCGMPGHNRSTCRRRAEAVLAQPPGQLIERVWASVRIARGHNMTSEDVAKEMGLDLKECNMAYCSPTYPEYLKMRRVRRRIATTVEERDEQGRFT